MSAIAQRPQSPLVILRRVYYELTSNHCAAKLIEYFKHWRDWKVKNHRTDWVYMPLRQIHEDLMGEHSLHVIRAAIALLEKLGFLKRRQNPGNGQDKTYQYQLQVDVIASALPETAECKAGSPTVRTEPSKNTAEQKTQITSTDIQNTNIKPTKQVGEEKIFSQEAEQLIEKYEDRLKIYGVYTRTWNDADELIPNPRFASIKHMLAKIPLDRAERSILAFLAWIKKAKNIEDNYKALKAAISRNWEASL